MPCDLRPVPGTCLVRARPPRTGLTGIQAEGSRLARVSRGLMGAGSKEPGPPTLTQDPSCSAPAARSLDCVKHLDAAISRVPSGFHS